MAVDIGNLVEPFQRKVNPPGINFITITDDDGVGRLKDAFWDAKLHSRKLGSASPFASYRVDDTLDTIVNIDSGGDDLDEDLQYLVVLYASLSAVETKLMSLPTLAHFIAPGPVSSEIQHSATIGTTLLENLREDLVAVRDDLVGGPNATSVYYIDTVLARTASLASCGPGYWVR